MSNYTDNKFYHLKKSLCFEDVQIVDDVGCVSSRSDVNLNSPVDWGLGGAIPVMSAAMLSIHSLNLGTSMVSNDMIYTIPRYIDHNLAIEQASEIYQRSLGVNKAHKGHVAFAVGLNDPLEYIENILNNDFPFHHIVVDTAALGQPKTVHYVQSIVDLLQRSNVALDKFVLTLGNFSNPSIAINLLEEQLPCLKSIHTVFWKVSQGGSPVCLTRLNTGVGVPTLQAILDLDDAFQHLPDRKRTQICADGGVRYYGDIAKAIVAGSHLVMCGTMFAGLSDCMDLKREGYDFKWEDGPKLYRHYGMASAFAKNAAKHESIKNVEGIDTWLPVKDKTSHQVVNEIKQNLQSSVALMGCDSIGDISCLPNSLLIVSNNSSREAKTF